MKFTTLFIDLDDTLYPNTSGLWPAIRERMSQYMVERLGLSPEQVTGLRRHYYVTYGTTLRGLQINHQVDADDYLAYVHNLPLEHYIQPDPELRELIASLPQKKWIFTNADRDHARRVLAFLGLEDLFTGIIDVRALEFYCKPEQEAYAAAMRLAGESNPRRCVMLDDAARNLAPAQTLGICTVLVGSAELQTGADLAVERLADLRPALPGLWECEPKLEGSPHGY